VLSPKAVEVYAFPLPTPLVMILILLHLLPGLRYVDIAGASLSNISIHTLASCCSKLVRLLVPHAARITNEAFTLLPERGQLHHIEEIDVSR